MTVETLEPGQNVNLTAGNPLLQELVIGFGWDVIRSNTPDPEIVPMALLLDDHGKVVDEDAVAFFNQLSVGDGAIQFIAGADKEQVDVTLAGIPTNVTKIVFLLFVNPDLRTAGTFRSVRDVYTTVNDRAMNALATTNLPTGDTDVNVLICGELYRYKGDWKFRALGDGYTEGIVAVARNYGFTL